MPEQTPCLHSVGTGSPSSVRVAGAPKSRSRCPPKGWPGEPTFLRIWPQACCVHASARHLPLSGTFLLICPFPDLLSISPHLKSAQGLALTSASMAWNTVRHILAAVGLA